MALTVYEGGGKRNCPTPTRYALVGPPTNFSMEKRAVKLGSAVVLLTMYLTGCTNNQAGLPEEQVDTKLIFEEKVCPDYEMLEKEDGWIYFTNVTTADEVMKLRIKGKDTTFEDFDMEQLPSQ